jgi:hypothetical protein
MATFEGVEKATEMSEISTRTDPAARFAVAFAQDLLEAGADDAALRRAVPQIGSLSADDRVRKAQVAGAILENAEAFLKNGGDKDLGPDLGTAAREHTLANLADNYQSRRLTVETAISPGHLRSQDGFVTDLVKEQHDTTSRTVGRYLEAGPANEKAISTSARILEMQSSLDDREKVYAAAGMPRPTYDSNPSRSELGEVSALAVARARAGVLPPAQVVETAMVPSNAAARSSSYYERSTAPAHQIIPDFEAGMRAVRNPLLMKPLVDAYRSTPENPMPSAVSGKSPAAGHKERHSVHRTVTRTPVESRDLESAEIMSFVENNPRLKPKTVIEGAAPEEKKPQPGIFARMLAGIEEISPGIGGAMRTRWENAIAGKVANFQPKDSEASRARAALEKDTSIEGRFASEVARRFAGKPMHEVAKTLPEVWREGHLPKDRDAAFVEIAAAARRVADRHMNGPDQGLPPAEAREAKHRALGISLAFDPNHPGARGNDMRTPLTERLEIHGREQIRSMRRELDPSLGPKPLRPENEPQADRGIVPPSKGAVMAMHAARSAGQSR